MLPGFVYTSHSVIESRRRWILEINFYYADCIWPNLVKNPYHKDRGFPCHEASIRVHKPCVSATSKLFHNRNSKFSKHVATIKSEAIGLHGLTFRGRVTSRRRQTDQHLAYLLSLTTTLTTTQKAHTHSFNTHIHNTRQHKQSQIVTLTLTLSNHINPLTFNQTVTCVDSDDRTLSMRRHHDHWHWHCVIICSIRLGWPKTDRSWLREPGQDFGWLFLTAF